MKKCLKRIYSIATTLMVSVLIGLAVLLVGVRVIGLTPYAVLSGSMEPTYPVGGLIYVQKVAPEDIKVGDPITFVLDEALTVATHRVVEIDKSGEYFYTKGDANESVDAAPVYYKNLIGKPVWSIPVLGYIANFLSTPRGIVVGGCAIGVVLMILFFPELLRLLGGKEEDR